MTSTSTMPMTAKEFREKSYKAYMGYVAFIEGDKSIYDTVDEMSPLMSAFGFALTCDNIANLLTVKMTSYGTDKGEKARKVKSISTFRAFVKGGWQEVQAAPVHSNAGKAPTEKKSRKTSAERIAELEAQIAALTAKND